MPEHSSPGLRERKKARLRERILEETSRLLRARGDRGLRIADLVEALEISQPTFFRYFESKEALIHSAARHSGERMSQWLRERQMTPDALARPLRESIQSFCLDLSELALSERRILDVLLRASTGSPWRRKAIVLDPKDAWMQKHCPLVVDPILEAARTRGELRQDCEVDVLGDMYVGVMRELILSWAAEEPPSFDLTRRMARTADILLDGMTAAR